jgi:hypothetical protein
VQDPTKAILVHWKPENLKIPIFQQAVRIFDEPKKSEHKAFCYCFHQFQEVPCDLSRDAGPIDIARCWICAINLMAALSHLQEQAVQNIDQSNRA